MYNTCFICTDIAKERTINERDTASKYVMHSIIISIISFLVYFYIKPVNFRKRTVNTNPEYNNNRRSKKRPKLMKNLRRQLATKKKLYK